MFLGRAQSGRTGLRLWTCFSSRSMIWNNNLNVTTNFLTKRALTAGGGKETKRSKRSRTDGALKPYSRQSNAKGGIILSPEESFLSSCSNLTNSEIVKKFGEMNGTRITAYYSPPRENKQLLKTHTNIKSCFKRKVQGGIVKDIDHQGKSKQDKRWKKALKTCQHNQGRMKIHERSDQIDHRHVHVHPSLRKVPKSLENAIDQIMKEFQKITIQEVRQKRGNGHS